jgi:hypothetical protein
MARRFVRGGEIASAVGTEEPVWNKGGAYTFATSEQILKYASSSANDVSTGTGARSIEIDYLDSEYAEKRITEPLGNYAVNKTGKGNSIGAVIGTDWKNLGMHTSLAVDAGAFKFTPTQQYDGMYQDSDGASIEIVAGRKYLARMKGSTSAGTRRMGARLYGILGSHQTETATVVGTITSAGDIDVTITSTYYTSPLVVKVAVENADDASAIAGKIRVALAAETDVTDYFGVSGATDKVILKDRTRKANDATLNIATANDTAVGLTAAPSSANTLAGLADSPISDIVEFDVEADTSTPMAAVITATGAALTAYYAVFDMEDADFVELYTDDLLLIDLTALGDYSLNGITKAYADAPVADLKAKYFAFFTGTDTLQYSIFSDFFRMLNVRVASTGSGLTNAGNISVTATGGTVFGYIATGRNATEMAITTVPKYRQYDIEKVMLASGLTAGGKLTKFEIKANYDFNAKQAMGVGTWVRYLPTELKDSALVIDKPELWFPAGTDIMLVTTGDATAKVSGTLFIREP